MKEFTAEIITEWLKCSRDFYYFAEKYLGYDFSDFKGIDKNRFRKYISARQNGKTTYLTAYGLWKVGFNSDHVTLFLSHNNNTSKEVNEIFRRHFEKLESTILGGILKVIENNSTRIRFDNNSTIIFSSNKHAGRGMAVSTLIVDEAAYYDDFEYVYTSAYPTISSNRESEIIIATTPNTGSSMDFLNSLHGFDKKTVYSRLPPERLEQIKQNIGPYHFKMEYLGA